MELKISVMGPTNENEPLELKYHFKIENEERNPYLRNMYPNIRISYCTSYWSDKKPNNFGYPLS